MHINYNSSLVQYLYVVLWKIYKSWLRGVFCVYTRPEPRLEEVWLGAYALQTSDGRIFRVVYTQNAPSNHDSCNILAIRQVQRCHFLQSGVYAIYTTCVSIG